MGVICYLVDPGAPLYALWIIVVLDLISRLFAEAKNHGGLYLAGVEGHICLDKMFRGTDIRPRCIFLSQICLLSRSGQILLSQSRQLPALVFHLKLTPKYLIPTEVVTTPDIDPDLLPAETSPASISTGTLHCFAIGRY